MSWSLQVSNGDLSFGSQGLNTVSGGNKLVQDLGCCLLEPIGTDPLHANYGSVIDGGVDSSGNAQSGLIGGPNNTASAALASAEVQRICQSYQQQQVARNNADLAQYGRSTLTAGEALLAVANISITQVETAMQIDVSINTGNGPTAVSTIVGS